MDTNTVEKTTVLDKEEFTSHIADIRAALPPEYSPEKKEDEKAGKTDDELYQSYVDAMHAAEKQGQFFIMEVTPGSGLSTYPLDLMGWCGFESGMHEHEKNFMSRIATVRAALPQNSRYFPPTEAN